MRLAIIGGSGYSFTGAATRFEEISTPYGVAAVVRGSVGGVETIFMYRHGAGHTLPPHRINYRANIWALRELGVTGIIATNAVGSLQTALTPGSLVLPNSFLDFTSGRSATFYDGSDGIVEHVDVTEPYCATLRAALQNAARAASLIITEGCYVCTNGPRYETASEVRAFALLGGNIVGMTGVPEVVLAREAGLCYASICLVTNLGAGISGDKLAHSEVLKVMSSGGLHLRTIVEAVVSAAGGMRCKHC